MLIEYPIKQFSLSFLLIFLVSFDCLARYPKADEVRFLPIYCQARLMPQKFRPAEVAKWKKIFASSYGSLHYYCSRVNDINLANNSRNPEEKQKLLYKALNGLKNYLAEDAGPNFPIRHITYYDIGKVAVRLGLPEKAINAFRSSIESQPSFMAPYRALSDIYRESGLLEDALQIINQGLKYSPNSKSLLRRKQELEDLIS